MLRRICLEEGSIGRIVKEKRKKLYRGFSDFNVIAVDLGFLIPDDICHKMCVVTLLADTNGYSYEINTSVILTLQ